MAHIEEEEAVFGGKSIDFFDRGPYKWRGNGPLASLPQPHIVHNYPEFRTVGADLSGWKFGRAFSLSELPMLYMVDSIKAPPWTFIVVRSRKGLYTAGVIFLLLGKATELLDRVRAWLLGR